MKFEILKEKTFYGANIYLDKQAIMFEIGKIEQAQFEVIKKAGSEKFSALKDENDFFQFIAKSVFWIQKLGLSDLYPNQYVVVDNGDTANIAIEYLDKNLSWKCYDLILNWYEAVVNQTEFDYEAAYQKLSGFFRGTLGGGPTIYSIIDAAYKRKIPFRELEPENVFQFGYGKNQQRGRSTIFSTDSHKDTEFTCQKDMCKNLLDKMSFPIPKGDLVTNLEAAREAAEVIGFPLVVKPVDGHKGIGVTTNIQTIEELDLAVNGLLANGPIDVIVEKFVTGTDHRLLVIGGNFAAALQRVPAFVIGDGQKTILELIAVENLKPERDELNPRAPINQIIVDKIMDDFIQEKYGYQRETVLKKDEKIYLRGIANISGGGVSINVTDIIHPDNIKLAETIAKYLLIEAFGIDALTDDISKSWKDPSNSFAIIEINAGPGIMMHAVPAIGAPVDTPNIIWNHLYPTFESARIPIIVFNRTTPELITKMTKIIQENTKFKQIGFANSYGVYMNGEWLFDNKSDYSSNVVYLLRHPRLEIAMLEYWSTEIVNYGLYYEKADAVIFDEADEIETNILTRELLPDGVVLNIDDEKGIVELVKKLYSKYNN